MMEPSMELVVPGLGQLVSLDDVGEVALAYDAVKALESELVEARGHLRDALVYHSHLRGSKTLHFEGGKAEIKGGTQTLYDAEAIEEGLRTAGMPEDRIRQIVKETVSYTVVAGEAKRAAGANADYAAVIAEHSRTVEKTPYASVTRR